MDGMARKGLSGSELSYPVIADTDRRAVYESGILNQEERDSEGRLLPFGALVILLGTPAKLTTLYPGTTGRISEEGLRMLVILQQAADQDPATPEERLGGLKKERSGSPSAQRCHTCT